MSIVNFHPNEAPLRFNVHSSFSYCNFLIFESGVTEEVHTYQMALLDRCWDKGMTIRIWYQDEDCYKYDEFKPGMSVHGKALRSEHNLYRLWAGGALGDHLINGFRNL